MSTKHREGGYSRPKWDESRIKVALATARALAARFARQRRLSRADREDLEQDILLALLEAAPRYDAERGAFATFVTVVARRALIDHARRPAAPSQLSLDAEEGRTLRETLAAPEVEIELGLALSGAADALPATACALLREIVARGDVVAAREARPCSSATFYRELHDLRCWLRALGSHPDATATSRRARSLTPSP